jgi:DNA-binding transcriptional LysR family regulator
MDLKWLEDFLCLARLGNFSRAAAERNVTQPAFSRRIRALENWLGAALLDREVYPAELTEAGREFLPIAADITHRLYEARAGFSRRRRRGSRTVTLAAQHALAARFLASWIAAIEKRIGRLDLRMAAHNYDGALQTLRDGACDFLLCFGHEEIPVMPRGVFPALTVGRDELVPVSAPSARGRPYYALPGTRAKPVPYLSPGPESFLGKVNKLILARAPCALTPAYEDAFSGALKSMALAGRGVAWLPRSSVREELAAGKLAPAGGTRWQEPLRVRLFRVRDSASPICDTFWKQARALAANACE